MILHIVNNYQYTVLDVNICLRLMNVLDSLAIVYFIALPETPKSVFAEKTSVYAQDLSL